jgi:hypothetical protein
MKRMRTRFLLAILTVFLPILLFAGCGELEPDHEVVIRDVVQVNWHEQTRYTFWVQKAGSSEIDRITIDFNDEPRRLADVPPFEKNWVKYTAHYVRGMNGAICNKGEIHLHNVKDIQGGGWDHGKFGRGTTSVIE